ncbi:MAG: (Fe-S)-binding protein [Phycisphaerales bacterium]|nr:(Fe-S)-binding protein [Phycisphaerales bacterium]
MKIALFITCLTETYYPRVGIATVKVLEHLGHEIIFPRAQTCCGQPMYNNGFHDDARDLARRMIRVFEPYETVVTPSGSCAAMIRDYYPSLFQDDSDSQTAAETLAGKAYEFVELLVNVLNVDMRELGVRWEGTATYHYSCHLRGLGMTDEAIRLIRGIDGLEYRPMDGFDRCCGFGGTFSLNYPSISGNMVRDKVHNIRETGADAVICNDAGCAMNIAGACRREGITVRCVSLAEIIAEGLGLLDREDAL